MTRFSRLARLWAVLFLGVLAPASLSAAPFAAYVMDARTGQPIYKQNADTRLHPASLTKMMTLYMAFTAIERGQVRLDSKFTVSSKAAAEPPSKLGLRPGQQIELRYLLRAAAIKSANDAATVIGEGLTGSEEAFARQMTQMAQALGMRNTQFRNAHGLTQEGHFSSAHDMTLLGRRLFYDFPQYYNLFSRRSADAGVAQVSSTNKRFLDAYKGADGIKTGYTRAAGFNLTASAQRGNKRLVATVLGGTSTAQRNEVMAQLLDAGFTRVPERVREKRPEAAQLTAQKVVRRAQIQPSAAVTSPQPQRLMLETSQKPARATRAAAVSAPVPIAEPVHQDAAVPARQPAASRLALQSSPRPVSRPGTSATTVAAAIPAEAAPSASLVAPVLQSSSRPVPAPRSRASLASPAIQGDARQAANAGADPAAIARAVAEAVPDAGTMSLLDSPAPRPRAESVILASMGEGDYSEPPAQEIVTRAANSGRNWGVSLGLYRSQAEAERLLLRSALQDGAALESARRHVANTKRGFEANFVNLSKADAQLVCDRFRARTQDCRVIGP
mgnify:CR=1 FL=1